VSCWKGGRFGAKAGIGVSAGRCRVATFLPSSSGLVAAPESGEQRVCPQHVVPTDRTRGNGHRLKQRKFCLNMRKNFFPLRVTEPWTRLPREVVESPSLEIFQTCLAAVLCSLLWVTLLGQGVGLGDPQRALPTPNVL